MRRKVSRVITSVLMAVNAAFAALVFLVMLFGSLAEHLSSEAVPTLLAGGLFAVGATTAQLRHPVGRLVTGIAGLLAVGVGAWLLNNPPHSNLTGARMVLWVAWGEVVLGCFVLFECVFGWERHPDDVSPSPPQAT